MLPNLDLILIALLHASFIACALLMVILIILFGLLLAFSLAVLSVSLFDLLHFFPVFSVYFSMVKDDIEFGLILIFLRLLQQAVAFASGSTPLHSASNTQVLKNAIANAKPKLI
ncbi:hypothetical protein L6164_015898 [Bauhinia variegata]|uniref:Uncharacterized protein n=1 Tax=Bauhinia variegata TaxID=167791 RepID=A0ACB9NN31_BAUVA|nr:hypothetical protein L6164_015898 [Bauhinia variegata]